MFFRFLFFAFVLALLIYLIGKLIKKWVESVHTAMERKEHEAWKNFDKKINPPKVKKKIKKKKCNT